MHLAHRSAGPDDGRKVVALLQLLSKVRVLVHQPLLVFLDEPLNLDRLRDARRGDAQKLHVAVVVAIRIELEIDAERATARRFNRIGRR
jgi:ABC-type phosphonate transport system ATPase subunit